MLIEGVAKPDVEAIVVGAGVCGIYQLYRLIDLGMRCVLLEAGEDVGGTWYKNRYPGCRFDSESVSYGYSFSKELLEEWDWKERFSAQPDTERYLRHVVDKFDLRKYMRFNSAVRSATYNEQNKIWSIRLADDETISCRYLVTAVGLLSVPTMPRYPGMERFRGRSFHTYDWPREGVELKGRRVAVIGTGSSGVQVISAIAGEVADLTVFQRRPNWCAPLHNAPISNEEMIELKRSYHSIFRRCKETTTGFIHMHDPRKTFEVSREERLALWEDLYNSPGFGIWLGNFRDVLADEAANAELTAFIADKILSRVKDPSVAEKLIPKDHGFGTRRVPMETNYYEAYNLPHVHLIDTSETPITEVTEKGISTSVKEFEFDVIVYATGFDAITGAFDRIDFVGRGGKSLRDKWVDGPRTTLGVMTCGFPNLIMAGGPQSGSVATNFPRGIEEAVDWISILLEYSVAHGYKIIEPTQEAEEWWSQHVGEMLDRVLLGSQKSWFTGFNSNIDGRDRKRLLIYTGGAIRFRQHLKLQQDSAYPAFAFS